MGGKFAWVRSSGKLTWKDVFYGLLGICLQFGIIILIAVCIDRVLGLFD